MDYAVISSTYDTSYQVKAPQGHSTELCDIAVVDLSASVHEGQQMGSRLA